MKRKARPLRSRRNSRRLYAEALEPRRLLAIDTWILDLDAVGSLDLFDPNAAGDLSDEYEQNPLSEGNIIATSNVPGVNNQPPTTVDDDFTGTPTNEDTPLPIAAPGVLTGDTEPDSDPFSAVPEMVLSTQGASVAILADGSFTYDPTGSATLQALVAGAMTNDTFIYQASDDKGATAPGTVTVKVNGLNDTPTATNLTQNKPYNEDDATVALDDIVITDPDTGDTITATLTLANTATGVLTAASGNGETYTPGTGIWTVTGSPAAVNTALAAVSFTPTANNDVDTTITTHIEDQAPSGPTDGAITLDITPINDEPSFTKGADETVLEDAGAQTVAAWATSLSVGPAAEAAQTLSFNITSNSNMALFSAQPAVDGTGQLTYTPAADVNGSAVITLNVMDSGGTANGGDDTSPDQTFTINVTAVNDEPSFTKGADTAVLEDAGAQTVAGWATGLSAGPADEAAQTFSFNITSNSNMALFSAQPAVDGTGQLTYTPAADANGSAVIKLNVMDSGGTTNGGDDTSPDQTFTINVTAVNDEPSFTKGADETVLEDAGAQTVPGWATGLSTGPVDEATQTLSFNITGNSNMALFSAQPAVDGTGQLTYTPAADANGASAITLNIMDSGGTANGGDDTSPDQTFTINVTAVNDPPTDTDEAFAVQANVGIQVNAAGGLLNGATDPESNVPIVLAPASVGTFATTAGGSITTAADGSFTYTPEAGDVSVADTFVYTANDSLGLGSTSTATFNVNAETIWFVDTVAGVNGDGTLSSPFNTLADLDAGGASDGLDDANDAIFVFTSDVTIPTLVLSDDFDLEAGQLLIGEGASGSGLNNLLGFTTQTNSLTLPGLGGNNAALSTGGSDAITLASGNTIRGIDLSNTGVGRGVFGLNFGTLTIDDVNASGTGRILDLTIGTLSDPNGGATFDNLASTSSGDGIRIDQVGGSFTVGGSTTITAGTRGINIGGAPASADYDFGATTISGVSNEGIAILSSNSGASFTFDSLSVTSGGTGLRASSAGTINIGGTGNTINSTSGSGVNVVGTSFGAGATFASVASVGGNPGILLFGTTGTATFTTVDIDNSTLVGISLNNADTVFINGGTIDGTGNDGISAQDTDLTISGVTLGATTQIGDDGIEYNNQTGNHTLAINSTTVADTKRIGIKVNGFLGGTITVESLAGNTVLSAGIAGPPAFAGMAFDTVTFDGNPGMAGIQAVTGGNTTIGNTAITTNVTGDGLRLDDVLGEIAFGTLNIGNDSGTGLFIRDAGGKGGTFAFSNTGGTINTTNGSAMDIDPVVMNSTFASVSSSSANSQGSGGSSGINLDTISGTVDINDGSITGATGAAFRVNAGNANITYTGTITNTANDAISVANTTGGTVLFNSAAANAITDSGTGISINTVAGNVTVQADAELTGSEGIDIDGGSGTFTFTDTDIQLGSAGVALDFNGGTSNVNFQTTSSIVQNQAAAVVSVSGGHTTGTLDFDGSITAGNGTGLQFNNADGRYDFDSVNSKSLSGGDSGIDIFNGSSGTFTFISASIVNPTGIGYREDSSTANVTYNGTITKANNANNAVDINAKTGGTTTFTGLVTATTSTAIGIDLTNNTSGTINFTGGLAINTTTGTGFNATGGGTVNVTGASNNIDTTTGTALELNGIVIGGSNMAFATVDKNGNGGVEGIDINSTTGGTLNVTSSTIAGNSGGASGVKINSSSTDVVFGSINVTDSDRHGVELISNSGDFTANGGLIDNPDDLGISATSLTGKFTLSGVTIRETGDAAVNGQVSHGVLLDDSTGDINISGSTFEDMNETPTGAGLGLDNNGVHVVMEDGGTLGSLQITNSTFRGTEVATLGVTTDHGVKIVLNSGSDITDIDITSSFASGLGRSFVELNADIDDDNVGGPSDIGSLNISGNGTFAAPLEAQSAIIEVRINGTSTLTDFDINNNVMQGNTLSSGNGIRVNTGEFGIGTTSTSLATGTISGNNLDNLGDGTVDNGIELQAQEDSSLVVLIDDNDIDGQSDDGIRVRVFDTADANVTISNNRVGLTTLNTNQGIEVQTRTGAPELCLSITGNNLAAGDDYNMIRDAGIFNLLNIGAGTHTAAQVDTFIEGLNTGNAASTTSGFTQCTSISQPLLAYGGEDVRVGESEALTDLALSDVVDEAVQRWTANGLSATQQLLLGQATFEIGDLPDGQLGSTIATNVQIDSNAASYDWFIDATPDDDTEFEMFTTDTERIASESSDAFGRMDLLTVVMHELGHVLGKDHADAPNLMGEELPTGTRRLPAGSDQSEASSVESQEPENADGDVDVNGDGLVTPIDLLLIMNTLDSGGDQPLELVKSVDAAASPSALDTNGDGIVSPLDALLVLNYLSKQATDPANGEASVEFTHPQSHETDESSFARILPPPLAPLTPNVYGPLPPSALELDTHPLPDDLLNLLAPDIAPTWHA